MKEGKSTSKNYPRGSSRTLALPRCKRGDFPNAAERSPSPFGRGLGLRRAEAAKAAQAGNGNGLFQLLVFAIGLFSLSCQAQPKSGLRLPPALNTAEAEQKGRAIVADLLAQRPQENSTNTGTMKIRNADGVQKEVAVQFEVMFKPEGWLNTYESLPSGGSPGEIVGILHSDAAPNKYWTGPIPASGSTNGGTHELNADQIMKPFAGSDFWIADLGLEFLHWPQQLLLKQEMRRSRSCNVLASINPHPVPGSYSRVVSWLDIESGGIVQAQAFDSKDKLLKEFAPKEMKKVQGQWQLEEMEIRNVQTGSRTRVQFNLDR